MKTLVVLAMLLVPCLASAEGPHGGTGPIQYGPDRMSKLPGGNRQGLGVAWGFAVGIGGMHVAGSNITSCNNCDYDPIALEADGHIGGFLGQRFALMAEVQFNGQKVHSDGLDDDTVLSQTALMIAGQVWLTPELWIKGGIGFAHLRADDAYFVDDLGGGGAIMAAVGFELLVSSRAFAIDLQGRIIQGAFNSFNDSVTSATVGVGLNWY